MSLTNGYVTIARSSNLADFAKNVANEYAFMLLAQGLSKLVAQKDDFKCLAHLLDFKVPVVLTQLLTRLLRTQCSDGSWNNGSHEVTAYCILALTSLCSVPFPLGLNDEIIAALHSGRKYLHSLKGNWKPQPIWIEKVRYYSPILTDVYCTSALLAPVPSSPAVTSKSHPAPQKMLHLFGMLPLFSSLPGSKKALVAALAESQAFLPFLKSTRLDIFPRSKDLKKEKYMEIIPFAWTACNALRSTPLPADILMEMMSISMLNFQADEYFELIATESNTRALRWLVDEACGVCAKPANYMHRQQSDLSDIATPPEDSELQDSELQDSEQDSASVSAVIQKYTHHVLQHPAVISAPTTVQSSVRHKLAGYLQAQISSAIGRSSNLATRTHQKTLIDWVRTLGAADTSCPYSLAFYMALSSWVLQENTKPDTANEYLLESLGASLATMCRMYNDYGSLARDREEGNLNCADFILHAGRNEKRGRDEEGTEANPSSKRMKMENGTANGPAPRDEKSAVADDPAAKKVLMELAQFERQCMEVALTRLEKAGLKGRMLEALLLFVDVTDLFGQIYVVRDIGSKTR
jgi:hypothetical protein